MKEKQWKEMNGWEKAWEATQIVVGWGVIAIVLLFTFGKGGSRPISRRGGSVWPVGGGGKKPGSWSSGRHR